ncbi:MAG: sodium-dependent bicarbonate transport family permease [Myxococcota bacterium]
MDHALSTLLSPVVLFFGLGFGAGLLRSSLAVPEALAKGLSLYLMLAIGFKGGVEMSHAHLDADVVSTVGLGLGAGFGLPVVAYALLRGFTRLERIDAASVAAHYGSISVVTFVAASDYLGGLSIGFDGYIIAVVALMETPAIIAGLWLAQRGQGSPRRRGFDRELTREVFLNGSVVLLLGSLAIGWLTGDEGMRAIEPFIGAPFKGVLCLFLLDMGLAASTRLRAAGGLELRLIAFGLVMPLVGATFGLVGSALCGLPTGTAILLTVLCASASYIAVPAAMRVALPQANPAYSLTLSLGITFPFNIVVGIPVYTHLARALLH